ncbi:MAG TPA: PASTA domain-containing protein [Acidimicrobiia bacterium]|nr:PASTA domain-containing protein [Acidimicrobiia bacterium]
MVTVRPSGGRPPRRPGLGPALGVVGMLVLGLAVVNVGGRLTAVDDEPATTLPGRMPPPAASAALDLPLSSPEDITRAIDDLGVLSVVDAGTAGVEPIWRLWGSDPTRPITVPLPVQSSRWALDPSGHAVAFLAPGAEDSRSLWVRYADGTGGRVAENALTFAWKTGELGRIAWATPGPVGIELWIASLTREGGLVLVDADSIARTLPGTVVGWTSLGVWVEHPRLGVDLPYHSAYAVSGHQSGPYAGEVFAADPGGDRILFASRLEGDWMVYTGERGAGTERIDWSFGSAEIAGAAWGPGGTDRVAFWGYDLDTAGWWVQVWDAASEDVTHRWDLTYRVLGASWDPSGRVALVSVTDDRDATAVLMLDTEGEIDQTLVFRSVAAATVVPVPGAVVEVPDVVGMPPERAEQVLAAAGVTVVATPESSFGGLVVDQSPPAGTVMDARDTAVVHVAPPPEPHLVWPAADGNSRCAPPSPMSPLVDVGRDRYLTEIMGSGDFPLYGLLLTPPPLRTDTLIKMVVRFDAGDNDDPIFLARHEARVLQYSRWGPIDHGFATSGYDRPGDEWGIGFIFREPGCWTIRVVVGLAVAEFFVEVNW